MRNANERKTILEVAEVLKSEGGRKRKRKLIILQDIQILPPKRKMEAVEDVIIIDSDDDIDQ